VFAYDASQWTDLFVATAGATAALAGLLFVAVSINLERIIGEAGLPDRALETVLLLVGVLVVSILCLVPGQSAAVLGLELLVGSIALTFTVIRLPLAREPGAPQLRAWLLARWGIRALALAPLIVGAASLMTGDGGGLYWIVAGVVFATVGAVANAWVLLVEILR
jgi:modulator of FtsH protease